MYVTIGAADVIDVVIAGAGGINISYYASYASAPGIAITNATVAAVGTYVLVPSPGVGNVNTLFGISIYNASATNSATLTIRYNNGVPQQQLFVAILPPGFTLIYDGGPGPGGGEGWQVYDTIGTKQ